MKLRDDNFSVYCEEITYALIKKDVALLTAALNRVLPECNLELIAKPKKADREEALIKLKELFGEALKIIK